MKNLITCSLVLIVFFAACKKDTTTVKPIVPAKTSQVIFPADSISYTIDGKNYTLNNSSQVNVGNTDADRKVDSIVQGNKYYISGLKDSVFFYRTFDYSNSSGSQYVELSFFRKYAIKDMYQALIYYPLNQGDLFKSGGYVYGTDFMRENATNGVALSVGGTGQTYSDQTLGIPSPITAASENNAHFRVLSFKQVSDDTYETQYVLEAKFDATLFDNNGATKQLTNGYARMNIAIAHQ